MRQYIICSIGLVCLALGTLRAPAAELSRDHPLLPVVKVATERLKLLDDQVRDYTCTLVKRERINGVLSDHEYIDVKLRQETVRGGHVVTPFSVYLRFLAPNDVKGREVVYVRGRNNGKMIVRRGGDRFAYVTAALEPTADIALRESHYPITDVGMKNLITRLLDVGQEELQYDGRECEVNYYRGAKIDNRQCTVIEVRHPLQRSQYRYHVARIFIDDEVQLPVRFASYDWPKQQGGPPQLIEEYTYLNVQTNVGLTDLDFDHRNEHYQFRKNFQP